MSIPNVRGPLGGTDTKAECHGRIYGEASYQPDDVLYQGSEDEDYDNPQSRRQKCEDAAQRYLNGHVPLLLSASLRGPFHKESGWQNPWRSKDRTSKIRQTLSNPHGPPNFEQESNQHSPSLQADESTEIPETLNCHLPSPESLKQAPYTESHPYLTQGTLAVVQEWRNTISPASSSDNHVLAESQIEESAGKRKRANSQGLKHTAAKRKKSEMMGHDSSDESVSRNRTVVADPHKSSVISVSSLLNGSSDSRLRDFSKFSAEPNETGSYVDETDHDDELSVSPAASLYNKSALPCKKLFSKRKFSQSTTHPSPQSDDELGLREDGSASLSSFLSHKCNSQSSLLATDSNDTKQASGHGDTEMDRSSSPLPLLQTNKLDVSEMGMANAENRESGGDNMDFETQQDNSFAYKLVRPKRAKLIIESLSRSQPIHELHHDSNESGETDTAIEKLYENSHVEIELGAEQLLIEKQPPKHVVTMFHHNLDLSNSQNDTPNQDIAAKKMAVVEATPEANSMQHQDDLPETSTPLTSDNTTDKIDVKSGNPAPLVEDLLAQNGEIECHNSTGRISPSHSQSTNNSEIVDTSESEAVPAHQPAVTQEKPFSIRSILNCCVSPLRKLSGLAGQSGISGQSNADSQMSDIGTAQGADQASAIEKESDVRPQQHDLIEMEKTEAEKASEVPVNDGTECIQPPSPANEGDSTTPLAPQSQTMETPHRVPSLSQQSPWISTQSSQRAAMTSARASSQETKHDSENASREGSPGLDDAIPVEAQSPWARDTETPSALRGAFVCVTERTDATLSPSETRVGGMKSPSEIDKWSKAPSLAQVKTARPSTPEPQFSTTSFASFMTPSPERHSRQQKQRNFKDAIYQSILASAMKNPWRSIKSDRRVSWAPLPHEVESPCGMRHTSQSTGFVPSAALSEVRPASPPPRTPVSQIPVSEDSRFRGHFAAMANRSGAFGHALLASSQREGHSPEPETMEYDSHDEDGIDTTETLKDTPMEEERTPGEPSHANVDDSQDPMDIVDDIFNELGDFLQTWDIDAELEAARKVDKLNVSSQVGIEAHGP